ncbi:dihydrofolate reductase family protein [Hymenobacter sp. HDW8]|uniref:dihydrofolate reductase family protein n=1 Tax=Hymenobacter sp. HDW8 TaxID=2714932 RepID=UPI00140E54FC|nr:dihydrofolate reductase family protein [Hymenobacter sp. HDW8]QIL76390.1 dihydrofolate reductase [Hymenobacter sp. HDW8]
MRKVVLYIAASLDGYIASSNGSVDWLPPILPESDYGYADFLASVDATLMGRTTYEQMLTFGEWSYPELVNYVFTSNPPAEAAHSSVRFVTAEAVEFVGQLRQQEGGTIWLIGGSKLAAPLLAAALVDELMLFVVPRLLGDGIPLWEAPKSAQPIKLLRNHAWPNGMILLHYQLTNIE